MTLTIEQINACCATAKLLLAAGKNLADPSLKGAFQELDELADLARIGAAVQQKPTDAMIEAARMTLPGPVDICDADIEDIFLTMIETLPQVKP